MRRGNDDSFGVEQFRFKESYIHTIKFLTTNKINTFVPFLSFKVSHKMF